MRLGKRRRVEELPFAGIHDVAADTETALFAVYGVSATLHPLDQSDDDEGAELVPWPEDSSDPVLVDRFDCRLLLDPSELIETSTAGRSRQRRGEAPSSSTGDPAVAIEAELEEQRWRDLFHPPHLRQHENYISGIDEEEELNKRTHGAAIPFTYLDAAIDTAEAVDRNKDRERVYYLEDLEPPPPHLYLHSNSQSKLCLSTVLKFSGGGSNSNNTEASKLDADLFRFTTQQYAIMQRTAEFLHTYGDLGGTEILFERALDDPTFAFLSPDHIWNDFFKELVEKVAVVSVEPVAEAQEILTGKEEQEKETENCLGALLEGYGSEEEKNEAGKTEENQEEAHCSNHEQEVVKTIIARLIKSITQDYGSYTSAGNRSMAVGLKEQLSTHPIVASIITPEGAYFNVFKKEIEGAVATGAMSDDVAAIWLGNAMKAGSVDGANANVKEEGEEKVEPQALLPAPAAKIKKERKIRKPTTAPSEIDENKKEERKKKARLLLERQQQAAEERRQGQAVAQKNAEEERNQHLAGISVHKRMFLDNSDDE